MDMKMQTGEDRRNKNSTTVNPCNDRTTTPRRADVLCLKAARSFVISF